MERSGVFLDGNGMNCVVSNHWASVRWSPESAKSLPLKNESLLNTTGTPDCSVNWPVSSQPPTMKLSAFGIELNHCLPRPTGSSQTEATEWWKGRSSPPSLCSINAPAISGPTIDVSSKSREYVNAYSTLKPLLNRCSAFESRASY